MDSDLEQYQKLGNERRIAGIVGITSWLTTGGRFDIHGKIKSLMTFSLVPLLPKPILNVMETGGQGYVIDGCSR